MAVPFSVMVLPNESRYGGILLWGEDMTIARGTVSPFGLQIDLHSRCTFRHGAESTGAREIFQTS
jgi:hypothetical protein